MPGLPDILKWHNLQSLNKALDLLIEFKFCESDFYFLNRSKNCLVATYNFGSVYIQRFTLKEVVIPCYITHTYKIHVPGHIKQ